MVIGGGTGTYTVVKGLKHFDNLDLTAVVTMADDGGSNKILRDEFGLLPTSGVRQCIVAMSEDEGLLRELFVYRYYQGTGISGMTFGNLFMAALSDITGSQKKAIRETSELLRVRGQILPISYESVHLMAEYEDGSEVIGEHRIDESLGKLAKSRIVKFRVVPHAKIDSDARKAIECADLIVIGPGDLYTNTVANLVIDGVSEAITASKGKVCFVMNLMTKAGESYEYKASDFMQDLSKYMDTSRIDHVVVNSDLDYDPKILKAYEREGAKPVEDDLGKSGKMKVIRAPVKSSFVPRKQRGDAVKRSMIRHDSKKLARVLVKLLD